MIQLSNTDQQILLRIARQSIAYGLQHGAHGVVNAQNLPLTLLNSAATFVTLLVEDKLRGCIGSIKARQSIADDVAYNAYLAAFKDSRFLPLRPEELQMIHIEISVLSEPEPIEFDSEAELLEKIRVGIDGIILQDNEYRGLFLPSVWKHVPEKRAFLQQLKRKAGLPMDYWSDSITCHRFTATLFSEKNST